MAANRTVSVTLQAKTDQYVAGMKKAGASTDALGKSVDRSIKQQALMEKTSRLVGGVVALAFGKQIISAASNLNETISKSGQVFGKNAAQVEQWSKKSAKAFGMSQRSALEAAATYGNLFVSMGTSSSKAAEMSTNLVQLAGDLAAFNNVDPQQALDALRSGLVGEQEPLRKFGVNLTEATLKAEAMRLGLVSSTKTALDPAAKSQAAYSLILQQTKTAQGNFALTTNNLAEQQKILTAEWEDASARLGQDLLPVATKAVGGLNSLLDVVNATPAPVRDVALGVGALGVAFVVLGPRLMAAKQVLDAMPGAMGKISKAGKGLAIVTAAIAAGQAITSMRDQTVNAGKSLDTLQTQLMDTSKPIDDLGFHMSAITTGAYDLNTAIATIADPGVINNVEGALASVFGVDSTKSQAQDAVKGLDDALTALASSGHAPEASKRLMEFRAAYVASGGSVDEFNRVFANSITAIDGVGKSTAATGATATKAAGEVKTFSQALKDLNAPAADVTHAQIAVIESAKTLAEGLRKQGVSFSLSTQAGRDNLNNLLSLTGGINDYGSALQEQGKSADVVRAAMLKERDALVDNLIKTGMAKDKAQGLVDKYLKIPAAAGAAETAIDKVTAAVKRVPTSKAITFSVAVRKGTAATADPKGGSGSGFSLPSSPLFNASGGPVSGPGTGTSDSIPAMLSNGEYVMRASAVDAIGIDNLNTMNAYADGGLVDIGFHPKKKKPAPKKHKPTHKASTHKKVAAKKVAVKPFDSSLADSLTGGADIMSFDFSAFGSAVQRATAAVKGLADAQSAITDAHRQINNAGTPEEMAAALKAQADAEMNLAAAKKEVADADKAKAAAAPTSKNILSNLASKQAALGKLTKNLGILKSRGLSPVLLREIVDAGIETGGQMAEALVRDGNIADLNHSQAMISGYANALGSMFGTASTTGGSSSGSTTGSTGSSAVAAVISFENANKPLVVQADGIGVIWKGLLSLKKAKGGASLGLS